MSVTSIHIPTEQLAAIRESLLRTRVDLEQEPRAAAERPRAPRGSTGRLDAVDRLLDQLASADELQRETLELAGPHDALWDALYDATCVAAERLAAEVNEYWRGEGDASAARALIGDVRVRFEILESLGFPASSRQDGR